MEKELYELLMELSIEGLCWCKSGIDDPDMDGIHNDLCQRILSATLDFRDLPIIEVVGYSESAE